MSISAWGIDHGTEEISKAGKPKERNLTGNLRNASLIGTIHPLASVAHGATTAKKGKKVRAAANQGGGALLGGMAGAGLGYALSRGRSSSLIGGGSLAGSGGGAYLGQKRNQLKGYVKRTRG